MSKYGSKNGKIWMFDKDKLEEIVSSATSMAGILKAIGFTSWSSEHYDSLRKRLETESISVEHIGNGLRGRRNNLICYSREQATAMIFVRNCPFHQRTARDYLKKYAVIPYQCKCGLVDTWAGEKLSLQLDHINGINKD